MQGDNPTAQTLHDRVQQYSIVVNLGGLADRDPPVVLEHPRTIPGPD